MGLIKSAAAPTTLTPFSMRDIESQANAILTRAREGAEALLAAARVEAEELKARARDEGLAEGREQGLAEGAEEGAKAAREQVLAEQGEAMTQAVTALATAMTELDASRQDLQANSLEEVIGLAVAVARRVTKRQGMIDPCMLSENLREAMKLVIHRTDVRIALHPSQRAVLDAAMPKLRLEWPSVKHIEMVDDASIAPGGCRVYSGHGHVDAELDVQLDRVVADLLPSNQQEAP